MNMDAKCLLSILVCFANILLSQVAGYVVMCYFTSWSKSRNSPLTRFDIKDIDGSLCTHLIYAFAKLDPDVIAIMAADHDENDHDGHVGRYRQFNALKSRYPHLKTLLSVGGENADSEAWLTVARSGENLLRGFGKKTVDFLRKRGFDGLDIDWEFPNKTTKSDFTVLMKTLRNAFDEETSGSQRLLLTAALAAGSQNMEGYDMNMLARTLDYANLMTYDYHGSWDSITGFNSPLNSRKSDPKFNPQLSTAWTVDRYRYLGIPSEKIVVGITPVGRHFTLADQSNHDVGSNTTQDYFAKIGDLYQMSERAAYPEICRFLQIVTATRVFDTEQGVPYAYDFIDWYGYDDVESIKGKKEWIEQQKLAGAMFWSLDMDDFTGKVCYNGTYPLLRTLASPQSINNQPTRHVNTNIRFLYEVDSTATRMSGSTTALKDIAETDIAFVNRSQPETRQIIPAC